MDIEMLDSIRIPKGPLDDLIEIIMQHRWAAGQQNKLVDLWNLCDNREQQSLLKELVLKFTVLDSDHERDACAHINDIIQHWKLKPNDTLIIAVANDHEIDGSTSGLQKLKNKITPPQEWHSRFCANIPSSIDRIENGMSIILFDDFIGTGSKMIKKQSWVCNLLSRKRGDNVDASTLSFYFISFSAMKFGLDHLKASTNCLVFSHLCLDKGISDSSDNSVVVQHKKNMMIEIEKKLSLNNKNKNLTDYTLGFEQSECLYIGQNDNCPNNVFPVFWWPTLRNGEEHESLFVRVG